MPRVMRVENWLANAPARPGVRYQRGYWKNGKRHGRCTTATGNHYKGQMTWDGLPHGQRTWTYANGARYEGRCEDGLSHEQGTMTWDDVGRYEGQWENGTSPNIYF